MIFLHHQEGVISLDNRKKNLSEYAPFLSAGIIFFAIVFLLIFCIKSDRQLPENIITTLPQITGYTIDAEFEKKILHRDYNECINSGDLIPIPSGYNGVYYAKDKQHRYWQLRLSKNGYKIIDIERANVENFTP